MKSQNSYKPKIYLLYLLYWLCIWTLTAQSDPIQLPDWLEISGDIRFRFEAFDGEDLNDDATDALGPNVLGENDEWFLTRLRLRADAHLTGNIRVFTELTDARIFEDQSHQGDFRGTQNNWESDRFDLFQGYVDLKLQAGNHLIFGRQVLSFGSQKFMGEYDYWNTPFSFDAIRLQLRRSNWDLDLFMGQNAVNDDGNFNDSDDSFSGLPRLPELGRFDDDTIYGAYWIYRGWRRTRLDLFSFLQDNGNQKSQVYTLGFRSYGQLPEFLDYEVEFMIQPGGKVRDRDHFGWTLSAELGRIFPQHRWTPRLLMGYDFATGDRDPLDDKSDAFDVTYADDYTQLGNQEFFTRRNLHAIRTGLQASFSKEILGSVEFHSFWVAHDDDRWFGRYQQFVRAEKGRKADNHIGMELDFQLRFPIFVFGNKISAVIRYSHFLSGDFVKDANGVADDAHEVAITFKHSF